MEKRSYRNRSHRQQHQQHYKSNETRKQHHRRRLVDEEEPQHQREEESSSFCALVGTCQFMCPENERSQRERLRDLAVFERLHGNPAKTSPELAVKKFCRTISSKHVQASDVRPLPVLENTLTHLLNLLDSTDYPFEVVHDFIFDRTRSIRQDLSMQNIENEKSIYLYEKMVRFHVLSHHKLRDCGNDPKISSMHYLNMEQLTKALTSLYNLYALNRQSGSIYENEPEFHSLFVLLHLDSKNQPSGEPLSLWFCHLPRQIIHSKEMHFARNLLRYFRIGNYRRFLATIVSEASYLQYCILEPYIKEVRALLLACINSVGYKLHPYPLSQVSKFLMMKETDAEAFCNSCALEISTDELGNKLLSSKQTTYSYPKSGLQNFDLCGFERIKGE